MNKILFTLASSCLFLISGFSVHAANVTITCELDGCSSTTTPFFNETNIYPGYSTTKTLEIVNNRSDSCHLFQKVVNTAQESILPNALIFDISHGANVYFNDSLSHLFDVDQLDLGDIAPGQSYAYTWGSTFDQSAGNEYQASRVDFDINMNFTCQDGPSPTPTVTPTPAPTDTPTASSNPDNPPTCNNSVPLAPTNLRTRRLSDGRVTLMWTQTISLHTGYLVAYGNVPGNYLYGVPDVGNDDHFTIGGLTYGAQYCFYVRSLNGCMPGGKTNEVCVNPGSTIPANITPIPLASPGVLGVSTTETDISKPPVLGTATTCQSDWMPFLFAIALVLNSGYFLFVSRNPILPAFISITSFIVDRQLLQSHCCQEGNLLCQYYYIGSILSLAIPGLISRLASRHH